MAKRDRLLLLPLVVALAAIGWFVLRAPARVTIGDGSVADEAGDAPPEAPGGAGGGGLAGGPGKPRPPKEAPPEPIAAPVYTRAEGVFGRVTDAREQPIPGAKVTLTSYDPTVPLGWDADGAIVATVDAAADGTYLVGPVPAGTTRCRVRAEAPGYARAGADVTAKGSRLDFHLDRGGALRVRVKDETGAAVAKAAVRAGENSPLVRVTGFTDASGEARLDGLPLGGLELYVECIGYGSATANDVVVSATATAEKTIVLRGAIDVTGKVADEAGEGVAGATVSVRLGLAGAGAPEPVTKSGADGRFTLSVPSHAGTYVEVTARKEGLGSSSANVQLKASTAAPGAPPGGGGEVVLTLGKASSVAGTVLDADGRPAADAVVVYANTAGSRGMGEVSARTDAEGRFALDLPPGMSRDGRYGLAAYAPGKGLGVLQFTPAKTPNPVVRLLGAGTVVGTVKGPDGAPAEGAVLGFQMDGNPDPEMPTQTAEFMPWMYAQALWDPRLCSVSAATDAEGRFRIESAPRGSYVTWVAWRGVTISATNRTVVRAGATTTLDLALKDGASIEGRVLDAELAPVVGATVYGYDPQNTQPGENHAAQARTDAEGRFVLRGVLGDHWTVTGSAVGFLPAEASSVRAGEKALELRLTPLGWIDGVVLGPDGKPYSGPFSASAQRPEESTEEAGGGEGSFAGADGAFRLRGLVAGPYVVSVTTAEGLVPSSSVRTSVVNGTGSGPVEIRLTRGASLGGVVLEDGTRKPIANASIALRLKGAATSGGTQGGWAATDAKGRFAIVGLAGGTYGLTATDPAGGAVEEEVRLDTGQEVEREFLTRRPGSIAIRVVDAEGRPVAKARVNLLGEGGTNIYPNWDLLQREGKIDWRNGWEAAMSTNAEGLLTRWHVPAGRVTITVRGRGVALKHEPVVVDVAPDRTTEATVTVTAAGPDSGGQGR